MNIDVSNSINSAIVNGSLGFSRASNDITQSAYNIAQRSAQSTGSREEFLSNAVMQQLGALKQSLPQASSGITADLVSLSINRVNAQASAKVIGVGSSTVGTLLDILA